MTVITDAVGQYPTAMQGDLLEAVERSTSPTVAALLDRRDLAAPVALMAGLALDTVGRELLDLALQRFAAVERDIPSTVGEVIIGGGAHAATYAAVRVAEGFPRPLVLDAAPRFGGVFALAGRAAFYLNSRNRPGRIGEPGTTAALNVLPGAPMQPADIGSTEYQTDADLGLVVRCALALNANLRRAKVEGIEKVTNTGAPLLVLADGRTVAARRVVVATGITTERTMSSVEPDGRTVYGLRQWFDRVGSARFPLRDLGRVAVIGTGDSARVVVESLTGLGPPLGSTVASLDYVERVDWYGIGEQMTRGVWCSGNRSRYQRLGALMPSGSSNNARVIGRERADRLNLGYQSATIDGRTYDTVIVATGHRTDPALDLGDDYADMRQIGTGRTIARADPTDRVYLVGPCAQIPVASDEVDTIRENRVGLFRLAPRTATLAAKLGPTLGYST